MKDDNDIYKKEFTEVGELLDTPEYGLVLQLTFGAAMVRLFKLAGMFGKRLEISFRILRYQRSLAQNRYMWGVAYTTIAAWYSETQGETVSKDAIHVYVLRNILEYQPKVENMLGQEVITFVGKSTSKLNTKEFNEFVEKLQAHFADKGCIIPDPKENNFLSDFLKDE